jgi:hypothetical protein
MSYDIVTMTLIIYSFQRKHEERMQVVWSLPDTQAKIY